MHGGTYSEALKMGFNAKQAGFFARLSVETFSEAIEHMENKNNARLVRKQTERTSLMNRAAYALVLVSGGMGLGIFVARWVV